MAYKYDALDWVILLYFLTHIPITYILDLQALLPDALYPFGLRRVQSWYIEQYQDPLFVDPQPWFRAILACEALLQLPFFFFAVYAWLHQREWVRIPALIYGVHVATTLVPILPTLALAPPGWDSNRAFLVTVYLPYLIVPLLIAWRCAARSQLFPSGKLKQ